MNTEDQSSDKRSQADGAGRREGHRAEDPNVWQLVAWLAEMAAYDPSVELALRVLVAQAQAAEDPNVWQILCDLDSREAWEALDGLRRQAPQNGDGREFWQLLGKIGENGACDRLQALLGQGMEPEA